MNETANIGEALLLDLPARGFRNVSMLANGQNSAEYKGRDSDGREYRVETYRLSFAPEDERDEEVIQEYTDYRGECLQERIREQNGLPSNEYLVSYTHCEKCSTANGLSYLLFVSRIVRGLDDMMLPDVNLYTLTEQVCEALRICHANGIIHRNIRKENLYFDTDEKGRQKFLLGRISMMEDWEHDAEPGRNLQAYDFQMLGRLLTELSGENRGLLRKLSPGQQKAVKRVMQKASGEMPYGSADELLRDLHFRSSASKVIAAICLLIAAATVIVIEPWRQDDDSSIPISPDATLGDIDGDGLVNSSDTSLLRQIVDSGQRLTRWQKKVCDVNGDGRVSEEDYQMISRFASGDSSSSEDFAAFAKQQQ